MTDLLMPAGRETVSDVATGGDTEFAWAAEISGPRTPSEITRFLVDGPLGAIDRSVGWEVAAELFDIVRALHDTVIQRLSGVSLLLNSPWDDDVARPTYQDVCGDEISSALLELRSILNSSLTSKEPTMETCAVAKLVELFEVCSPLVRQKVVGAIPSLSPPVCRILNHTLSESFRNMAKHARPEVIDIDVDVDDDLLELTVINDGVRQVAGEGAGLGVRLLAMDAATCGGTVVCRGDGGRWITGVTIPLSSAS